jgi:hypothetical protein
MPIVRGGKGANLDAEIVGSSDDAKPSLEVRAGGEKILLARIELTHIFAPVRAPGVAADPVLDAVTADAPAQKLDAVVE